MHGTLFPCLGSCSQLLLGYVRYATETDMKDSVGPSFAVSFEPLVHGSNEASLSLFYSYYFGRWSSELDELVSLSNLWSVHLLY